MLRTDSGSMSLPVRERVLKSKEQKDEAKPFDAVVEGLHLKKSANNRICPELFWNSIAHQTHELLFIRTVLTATSE